MFYRLLIADLCHQADVYSMGITAYTIVTGGRHPFDDLAFRNVHEEALIKVCNQDNIIARLCILFYLFIAAGMTNSCRNAST